MRSSAHSQGVLWAFLNMLVFTLQLVLPLGADAVNATPSAAPSVVLLIYVLLNVCTLTWLVWSLRLPRASKL